MFAPKRYLVFSHFDNTEQIHIREYEMKEMRNGMGQCEYPTKKGVCFTPTRLRVLRNLVDEIDENLVRRQRGETVDYKKHVGTGIYATVGEYIGVDLRRYWIPEGQPSIAPTKRGIFLPPVQWNMLKEKLNELLAAHPNLAEAEAVLSPKPNGNDGLPRMYAVWVDDDDLKRQGHIV